MPTVIRVQNDNFADVVVRTPDRRRVGLVTGLQSAVLKFCWAREGQRGLVLDPVGRDGFRIRTDGYGPGWTIRLRIGPTFNLTFSETHPPASAEVAHRSPSA